MLSKIRGFATKNSLFLMASVCQKKSAKNKHYLWGLDIGKNKCFAAKNNLFSASILLIFNYIWSPKEKCQK
jgi:hypothetical protein